MQPITRYHFFKFCVYAGLFSFWMSNLVSLNGTFEGILLAFLSWSFFVICTPIILEGFLTSFLAGIFRGGRLYEVGVYTWFGAVLLNLFTYNLFPEVYTKTLLTNFLYIVISRPFPERFILVLCALGTFYAMLCHLRGKDKKGIHKFMGWMLSGIGFAVFLYFYYNDLVLFMDLYL